MLQSTTYQHAGLGPNTASRPNRCRHDVPGSESDEIDWHGDFHVEAIFESAVWQFDGRRPVGGTHDDIEFGGNLKKDIELN